MDEHRMIICTQDHTDPECNLPYISSGPFPSDRPEWHGNHLLGWQTAFWSLLAVALNTMCQPSGMILGLPSEWNFYLRISPVFCLSNVIITLGDFIGDLVRKRSASVALKCWQARRFANRSGNANDSHLTTRNNFDVLRGTTACRIILFVLGALIPAIKLYGCSGIVRCQILCSIYLASFLVDEAFNAGCAWISPRISDNAQEEEAVVASSGFSDAVRDIAGALDVGMIISETELDFWSSMNSSYFPTRSFLTSFLMASWKQIPIGGYFVYTQLHRADSRGRVLLGIYCCVPIAVGLISAKTADPAPLAIFASQVVSLFIVNNLSSYSQAWAWNTRPGIFLDRMMDKFWCTDGDVSPRNKRIWMVRLGAAYYFFVGAFTFAIHYDSSSTYSPAWLNVLG